LTVRSSRWGLVRYTRRISRVSASRQKKEAEIFFSPPEEEKTGIKL
jgi:hypothetical protein